MNDMKLYTPAEVAEAFGVSTITVRRWTKTGKLPCIRTLGGHHRYRHDDLVAAINKIERD